MNAHTRATKAKKPSASRLPAHLLLAVLLVGLVALASAAQNPQQPAPAQPPPAPAQAASNKATIKAATELVEVDVEITGRDGKPVKGLRQDQFSVSEDGHEQKVSTFDYNDVERIETAGNGPDTAPLTISIGSVLPPEQLRPILRDRRMIVLFFDLTSLQPQDLTRSTDAAKKFLREQMSPADLVGVMAFGNQLKVVADFTNDKNLLNQAVDALLPGKEAQLAALADAAATGVEATVSEDTDAAFTPDETEFNVFNTDRKLAALESVTDLLRDIPGKKSVIQFTSGITQTGEDNRSQLRATTDAANRANVAIYTVDSRGLMTEIPGGDASTGGATGASMFSGDSVFHQQDQRQDSRETLATLATDTGGRSFFDLGDLGQAFKNVQDDTAGYYLLGYYSTNPAHDGRWRTIRVKVGGVNGAKIRYREGYYAPKAFGIYTTEDRERQLEEAMTSAVPEVELPIAVETGYFRVDAKQFFVPISAKLASSALEWARKTGRRQAQFDFVAEVRDAKNNRVAGALRDTITVRLDDQRFQQVQQNALVYQGGMLLPPGDYDLKFLARENETGHIGTFDESLKLPAPVADRLQLSTVLLSSQLVEDRKTSEVKGEVKTKGLAPDAKLKRNPLDVEGERVVPSVTRVFTSQQELYVFFQVYAPEKSDPAELQKLRAGLEFFRNGARINQTPMLAPTEVNAATHAASFRMDLPLLGMADGRYTVEAVVVEAGGGQAAFGRNYFALQSATPPNTAPGGTPAATPGAAPGAATPAPAPAGGN